MAKAPEQLVTQSILDRLIATDDWPTTRAQSIRLFRDSIKRNLEWLLARHSVIYYGLIDLGSLSIASSKDHQRLIDTIAEIVEHGEPRLKDVTVSVEESELAKRRLRFHIQAQMQLRPMPEEIAFDTVLDLTTGEYKVS
jgi:type VI secretion system protein ImpF